MRFCFVLSRQCRARARAYPTASRACATLPAGCWMFAGVNGMTSPAAHGGPGAALWDVLRKEVWQALPSRRRCNVLREEADAPCAQARKLEGEVDSKLAAFSKLGAPAALTFALATLTSPLASVTRGGQAYSTAQRRQRPGAPCAAASECLKSAG